jgi:hypothetical protein
LISLPAVCFLIPFPNYLNYRHVDEDDDVDDDPHTLAAPFTRNKGFHTNSFFPRTVDVWNKLPSSCFPLNYNIDLFNTVTFQIQPSSLHTLIHTVTFCPHLYIHRSSAGSYYFVSLLFLNQL